MAKRKLPKMTAEEHAARDRTQEMVREMNKQKKTRDEISAVLKSQFDWGGLEMQVGLDGVITEMR